MNVAVTSMSVQAAIRKVIAGNDLAELQAYAVASALMRGEATHAQIAALLVGLRMKGESPDEILGFVRAMRDHMTTVSCRGDGVVDTCGTGGDGAQTFNISTVAALVAAGAGCRVAKHGNRAVSSHCGSADLLEALGVRLDLSAEEAGKCIEQVGVGFLFAPRFHPSLKHAAQARREIGVRSILNLAGPLANPAGTTRQLIGVFDGELTEPLAEALLRLGSSHCLVVHGDDGLDEISLSGPTRITEAKDGFMHTTVITPEQFGFERVDGHALRGSDTDDNVRIARSVLAGTSGPPRDIVALNAGAAIYVAGRARTLEQGVDMALESLASGRAMQKLEHLRQHEGAAGP